jgi:hypothetical protein
MELGHHVFLLDTVMIDDADVHLLVPEKRHQMATQRSNADDAN